MNRDSIVIKAIMWILIAGSVLGVFMALIAAVM